MTPQLFISYKLKSVAHLPWRMLTYKALNTFIDDLFAFVIKMPVMYRIAACGTVRPSGWVGVWVGRQSPGRPLAELGMGGAQPEEGPRPGGSAHSGQDHSSTPPQAGGRVGPACVPPPPPPAPPSDGLHLPLPTEVDLPRRPHG